GVRLALGERVGPLLFVGDTGSASASDQHESHDADEGSHGQRPPEDAHAAALAPFNPSVDPAPGDLPRIDGAPVVFFRGLFLARWIEGPGQAQGTVMAARAKSSLHGQPNSPRPRPIERPGRRSRRRSPFSYPRNAAKKTRRSPPTPSRPRTNSTLTRMNVSKSIREASRSPVKPRPSSVRPGAS